MVYVRQPAQEVAKENVKEVVKVIVPEVAKIHVRQTVLNNVQATADKHAKEVVQKNVLLSAYSHARGSVMAYAALDALLLVPEVVKRDVLETAEAIVQVHVPVVVVLVVPEAAQGVQSGLNIVRIDESWHFKV